MWSLIWVYLAGAVATWGGMSAFAQVSGEDITVETYASKAALSWYSFGMLIVMILAEIGEKIDKK